MVLLISLAYTMYVHKGKKLTKVKVYTYFHIKYFFFFYESQLMLRKWCTQWSPSLYCVYTSFMNEAHGHKRKMTLVARGLLVLIFFTSVLYKLHSLLFA